MKNKEFWNSKKELDAIEARLEIMQKEAEETEKKLTGQGEDYSSDTDKKLRLESALHALLYSAIVGIILAVLIVAVNLAAGMRVTPICLLPAPIAFLFLIPITYTLIYLKHRSVSSVFKKLDEMSNGIFEQTEASGRPSFYKDIFDGLNTVSGKMEAGTEDLKTAIRLAHSANETKANFISNMSHEMRTPINAIMGMNEMILRESTDDNIRNYSAEAKNAAETLLSMVDDLLDTSKLETGRLELVPLSYNFSDVITGLVTGAVVRAREKGLKFEMEVDPEIPEHLFGDEARVRQCIRNLLSNGIKFTEQGSVCLKVGYSRIGHDEIELTVSIKDTGIGIDKQNLEKLFEPFERLDTSERSIYTGSGLGISITRKLLKLMSSELEVESTKGEGSVFSFKLVQRVTDWKKIGNIADRIDTSTDGPVKYSESFHAPEGRILVVDDSSVNLMIVQGLLKDTGVAIDTAESGAQAVSLAKINKYDIAYVDHMMPEMDGIETMRHIRNDTNSLNRRIPIIVLTANVVPGGREEYIREGFNDYLSKPVDPKALEHSVMENLPKHKVQAVEKTTDVQENGTENVRDAFLEKIGHIKGIVPALGINYAGGIELYKKVVEEFATTGLSRADMIEQYFEQEDIRNYTIQVHALKSSARILGNQNMSELAEKLENAGKEENTGLIESLTPELLKQFRETVTQLQPLFESDEDLPEIDTDSLKDALTTIAEMVEAFDFDSADMVMGQLKKFRMPENLAKDYSKLKTLMAEVARDDIIELAKNVLKSLN